MASHFDSATISFFFVELGAVGFQLAAHGAVGRRDILLGRVDEVEQHLGPLDVAEEARADAGAFARAFDEPGDVGQHEVDFAGAHDAEVGVQRRERIGGDLRLGRAHGGEEGRLAGVGQPDDAGVGDQLQAQPDGQLLGRLAGVDAARRLVGRGFEMRVAEAAVAALGEQRALADLRQIGEQRLLVLGDRSACRAAP